MSQNVLFALTGSYSSVVRCGWCGPGGYTGVVPGWVYRVGNTGVLYRPSQLLEETSLTAKRAPEVPCRGTGVGGQGGRTYGDGGHAPRTTLRARSVPVGPPCPGTLLTRLSANRGEIPPPFP